MSLYNLTVNKINGTLDTKGLDTQVRVWPPQGHGIYHLGQQLDYLAVWMLCEEVYVEKRAQFYIVTDSHDTRKNCA
jgi:hypothetical protein